MNKFAKNWLKRRWFDFRMGHGTYLVFLFSYTNFLLLSYNFLVLTIPFLESLFPSLLQFAVIGIVTYVPIAVYVGHLHNQRQMPTDVTVQASKNPYYKTIMDNQEEILRRLTILEEQN